MNCKTCEYPLWNLKARTCPECNTPFAPSQFTFQRHRVAFCCPHCDQPYYGTGEAGHLEPRGFMCSKCGQSIHEDQMVLRPGPGVAEDSTGYTPIPWLDTKIRSTLGRLWRTVIWSLFFPGRLGARLPSPERPLAAVGFALAAVLTMMVPAIVLTVLMAALLPGGVGVGMVAVGMLSLVFGAVVWSLVLLLPWAATAHLVLWMTGSSRAGFKRTLACLAYGVPACLPMAVPGLGLYLVPIGMIAWGVLSAIMIRWGQRVSWGRAFFAAGLFPAILGVALALLILLVVVPGYRSAMAVASQSVTTPAQQATTISTAVLAHAGVNNGAGPVHGSELLLSGVITAKDLQSGQIYRTDARGSFAATNLFQIEMQRSTAIAQTVRAAAVKLAPPGPITAHRFGDVVFTYHGMDLNAPADPGLWIFVITTEPSPYAFATQGQPVRPPLAVANADGTVAEIADTGFAAALDAQNDLRAASGLPRIPDPRKMVANAFTTPSDAPPAPVVQPVPPPP